MSTTETKIELVTEAIEALVLATVIAAAPLNPNYSQPANAAINRANHQNIVDAREVLAKAVREVLAPVLRVVGGGSGTGLGRTHLGEMATPNLA